MGLIVRWICHYTLGRFSNGARSGTGLLRHCIRHARTALPRLSGTPANARERNASGLGDKRKKFAWPQESGIATPPLPPFPVSRRRRRHQCARRYAPSQYLITYIDCASRLTTSTTNSSARDQKRTRTLRSSQLACSTSWPLPCSFTSCGLVSSSAQDGYSTKRICGYKGTLRDQLRTV
jgi:hypothetical protein